MRALLQRCREAAVAIDGAEHARIGPGLLILLGVGPQDGPATAQALARRCASLRLFADEEGRTNLDAAAVQAQILVVSQFTLYADCRKGRRPSFTAAGPAAAAAALCERFIAELRHQGLTVRSGVFGADMQVSLVNDGPFTLWLDSAELGLEHDAHAL